MHQIRYFLAVCAEHNFTRAAKQCHVSQPSLTRAIKLLEAELGGSLFRRERSHSHLTELGEIVRPHLQQVWDQSFAAITNAHEFSSTKRSRLRIGIMCSIAPALLIDLLARMRTRHRAIEVEIVDGSAGDLEEQLLGGHLGAAIFCRPHKSDQRLIEVSLFRERLVIAMPRRHRLAGRPSIAIADLVAEPLIHRPRCEYGEQAGRLFRQHQIHSQIAIDTVRDDWALAVIARGFGLGLFPEHSVDHPGVVARPLAEPELWREVGLFVSREQQRSEGAAALVHEATHGISPPSAARGMASPRRRQAK